MNTINLNDLNDQGRQSNPFPISMHPRIEHRLMTSLDEAHRTLAGWMHARTIHHPDASSGASAELPFARGTNFTGKPPVLSTTGTGEQQRCALVIEHDPASRKTLSLLLQHRGWRVTAVDNCATAEQYLPDDPDAIIVDLDRGESKGETLLRHIRAAGLKARVAVITDNARDPRVPRLAQFRPDALLSKPLNFAALLRTLTPSDPSAPPAWN